MVQVIVHLNQRVQVVLNHPEVEQIVILLTRVKVNQTVAVHWSMNQIVLSPLELVHFLHHLEKKIQLMIQVDEYVYYI